MNLLFKKVKVLVVEDENIIARDIESTLKRIGHESAGIVSKGEDAITASEKVKPDLILMDISMPELDGISASKEIRSQNNDFAKNVPIIAMTSFVNEAEIEKFKLAGIHDYIRKPFDAENLINLILKYATPQPNNK